MEKVKPYAKALVGGAAAMAAGLAVGYADDTLTRGEFWTAVAGALGALGVTFGVPNRASHGGLYGGPDR